MTLQGPGSDDVAPKKKVLTVFLPIEPTKLSTNQYNSMAWNLCEVLSQRLPPVSYTGMMLCELTSIQIGSVGERRDWNNQIKLLNAKIRI